MTTDIRILVTGSRDWDDISKIEFALLAEDPCAEHGECTSECPKLILVHGDCPTGADAIADDFAKAWGIGIEKYPAEWDKYGKKAGFIRNKIMVYSGVDVCLAFIKNNSKGASMTARFAEAAGIPVKRFEVND